MNTVSNPNKYLEKLAGSKFNKAVSFVDDLLGHTHSNLRAEANTLSKAEALGRKAKDAIKDTEDARSRMIKARVKTGVGLAGVGTAGFLGIHKYHQHRDDAIMRKIDSMYIDPTVN